MALRQVMNAASLSTSVSNSPLVYLGRPSRSSGVNIVTMMVAGQMAGSQVKMQVSPVGSAGPWYDVASTTVSTSAIVNVELADGIYTRLHLYSVSAGVTSVDAWLAIGSYTDK